MVKIYGFDEKYFRCVPCINAKRFCTVKGKEYEFISVVNGRDENGPTFDEDVISELLTRLGRKEKTGLTMPQIFDGDIHIGGFSELRGYSFG